MSDYYVEPKGDDPRWWAVLIAIFIIILISFFSCSSSKYEGKLEKEDVQNSFEIIYHDHNNLPYGSVVIFEGHQYIRMGGNSSSPIHSESCPNPKHHCQL